MAIIPLQIEMVCNVLGQAHGVSLDQGHIREFVQRRAWA
jgi:uncharacterized protein (DUF697 family)